MCNVNPDVCDFLRDFFLSDVVVVVGIVIDVDIFDLCSLKLKLFVNFEKMWHLRFAYSSDEQ